MREKSKFTKDRFLIWCSTNESSGAMNIPYGEIHRRHKHKIAGALVAVGAALIALPDPVFSTIVGGALILLALLIAFAKDKKRK